MITEVTEGIKITVKTTYRAKDSDPLHHLFLFSYRITIENQSEHTVKLLRRHWQIFDSSGEHHEVEGEGVTGQQPVLLPGDVYEYDSTCDLHTDMGKMQGSYLMERKFDKGTFHVIIPEFQLIAPYRCN